VEIDEHIVTREISAFVRPSLPPIVEMLDVLRRVRPATISLAFSSEADSGSRKESASK
jgi:hypothetical protein